MMRQDTEMMRQDTGMMRQDTEMDEKTCIGHYPNWEVVDPDTGATYTSCLDMKTKEDECKKCRRSLYRKKIFKLCR